MVVQLQMCNGNAIFSEDKHELIAIVSINTDNIMHHPAFYS